MNGFDTAVVVAFYNSFRKIKLNCGKENMLILNTCSFVFTHWQNVFFEDGSENFVKFAEIYP